MTLVARGRALMALLARDRGLMRLEYDTGGGCILQRVVLERSIRSAKAPSVCDGRSTMYRVLLLTYLLTS